MSEGDSNTQIIFNRATAAFAHKVRFKNCAATQSYVANGQSPAAVSISSGQHDVTEAVGLDVPDVFHLNTATVVKDSPDCPVRVGLAYSNNHFHDTNLYLTSMSSDGLLLPYIRGEVKPGRFMQPWMDMCDRIFALPEAAQFLSELKLDVRQNDRLAALILSCISTEIFSSGLNHERYIQCSYRDANGIWENHNYNRNVDYIANLRDMWEHHEDRLLDGIFLPSAPPKELHIICSDARVGRIFGKNGNLYSCIVAAIIGSEEDQLAHPVRAIAEDAYNRLGIRHATVTGHSGCGGIKAAIDHLASNHPHPLHPHLEAGLKPALPFLQQVIDHAKKLRFLTETGHTLRPEVYTLGEQVVAQAGAVILTPIFGESKVDAYHLKLNTRKVHVLQPFTSIADTYADMHNLKTLWDNANQEQASIIVKSRSFDEAETTRQRSLNLLNLAAAGGNSCGCSHLHA